MSDIFPWLTKEEHERFVHLNLISRVNSLEVINLELAGKLQVAQGRIAELEEYSTLLEKHNEEQRYRKKLKDRIACLEAPLCIGETTIRILAKEGAKVFENGQRLVAADELFKQDPYARIAELEATLREVLDCIDDPYNDLAIQIGKVLEKPND